MNRAMALNALKRMIGEFSRNWDGTVTWARNVVEPIQTICTAAPRGDSAASRRFGLKPRHVAVSADFYGSRIFANRNIMVGVSGFEQLAPASRKLFNAIYS